VRALSAERASRDWRGLFKEDRMTRRSWLVGNVSPETTVTAPHSVYAVKFDDEKVVCAMQDSHIKVYDRKTGLITLTLSGHRDWVGAVQYDDTKARHTVHSLLSLPLHDH
jgi:WD40 repeat protein